ncbi:MAG: beta-propeller fold lactonase family protein [Terracidiphilus sp.]|jgi:6-phosphogluconolactonase (cycloisomerase 2 family)
MKNQCVGFISLGMLAVCSGCGGGGSTVTQITPPASTYYAYVANQGTNTAGADSGSVITYSMSPSTGALTAIGVPLALTGAYSITVDPAGKFAYVPIIGTPSGIQAYSINSGTGVLTAIGSPVATGHTPTAVVIDPTSKFAYASTSAGIWVYSIGSTGALTALSGTPFSSATAYDNEAMSATGFLYAFDDTAGTLVPYAINSSTGALTAGTGIPFASGALWSDTLAVNAAGSFVYVLAEDSGASVYTLSAFSANSSTGALTAAGSPAAVGGGADSVALTPSGKYAYVANGGDKNISAYSINASTGALTAIGSPVSTGASSEPWTVAVDPTGSYLYALNMGTNPSTVAGFAINSSTGALTPLSGSPVSTAGTYPYAIAFATE